MNLHQRGTELINGLKDHVLEVLREHPEAEHEGTGVLQEEIARRAGLHNMGTGELDHTCGEMLRLLHKEGRIELVDEGEQDEKKKRWRLKST
jgi:triphosphoribosyl-dephospho-CoA synthetase